MRGIDLYHLATALKNGIDSSSQDAEAKLRTVINRAYYGAFIEARDQAKIRDSGVGVHASVRNYYLGSNNKAIGNRLKDLHDRRTSSDYNMTLSPSGRDAGESLRLSKEILKGLGIL